MNIDEFIEHAKEKAREHRYHADFFGSDNPMNKACIKSAEDCEQLAGCLEKSKEYLDLEEQGLLLRLPCKVGDTAYCIEDKKIWDCIVDKVTISRTNGVWFEVKTPKSMPDISAIEYTENAFGETVFLTQAEAEAKLKELRGKQNDGE